MSTINRRIIRQCSEAGERSTHLRRVAFEQSPTATDKQRVAAEQNTLLIDSIR